MLERATSTRWNWWLLGEPLRLSHRDACFVQWTCQCGQRRQVELPKAYAKLLRALLEKRTVELGTFKSIPSQIAQQPGQQSASGRNITITSFPTSISGPAATSPSSPPSLSTLAQGSPPSAGNATMGSHNTAVVIDARERQSPVVLCAVKVGVDSELVQIPADDMSDDLFFQRFRQTYYKTRGFLRRWLNITVFDQSSRRGRLPWKIKYVDRRSLTLYRLSRSENTDSSHVRRIRAFLTQTMISTTSILDLQIPCLRLTGTSSTADSTIATKAASVPSTHTSYALHANATAFLGGPVH